MSKSMLEVPSLAFFRPGARGRFFALFLGALCLVMPTRARAEAAELEPRIQGLEGKIEEVSLGLEDLRFKQKARDDSRRILFEGYVDFGYYMPEGNGAGFVPDVNDSQRDRFPDTPWIFLGDPWSTPVNSRGEPAETDISKAIPFDEIDSQGKSSFIVNEVNLDMSSPITDRATAFASVDFLPRSGRDGATGDRLDVDFGYLEWRPRGDRSLIVEIGKYRSAFGLEYRVQESPDRVGISPSLIHRYVGGHPLGIKARYASDASSGGQWIANLSLQNGNSHIETFTFAEELDGNDGKTVSGRVSRSWRELSWADFLELGGSFELGAESRQPDQSVGEGQWGLDLVLEKGDHALRMEFVNGDSDGGGEASAQALDFRGMYAEYQRHIGNRFTGYVRGEFRQALHLADDFAYVIDISRWTVGARYDIAPRWIMKAEYLKNLEHGPVPDFENDLALLSQVLVF